MIISRREKNTAIYPAVKEECVQGFKKMDNGGY
jgi:hypothetical protein